MFCKQSRKKQRGNLIPCSNAKAEKNYEPFQLVIDKATQMYEWPLLERIEKFQFHFLPIPYHRLCKTEFLNKYKANFQTKDDTDWHQRRKNHKQPREKLYAFIQECVIGQMHIFQFNFIINFYRQLLLEEYFEEQLPKSFDTANQQAEIKEIGDQINFIYNYNHKHIVSSSATLQNVNMKWVNEETTIISPALLLRQFIVSIKKMQIPRNVNVAHLIKDEYEVSEILIKFFAILLTGGNVHKIKNPCILVLAKDNKAHYTWYYFEKFEEQ